eukprot:SM000293S10920  [mRNA]  locus=s293:20851:23217:- [translate_table: standard]
MAEHLASIFGTEKDRVNCPFYFKIGACRHGDRCSRIHNRPSASPTLLFSNMYQSPDAGFHGGVDAEGNIRQSDPRKLQEHFEDFYEDIFEELSKYGEVENLNVCDNLADHMIGNVYVKFREEDQAAAALHGMAGRFYSGRPILVEPCPVTDFREATCRQYEENTCNRGGYCNFMHLKKISRELRRKLFGSYKRRSRMTTNLGLAVVVVVEVVILEEVTVVVVGVMGGAVVGSSVRTVQGMRTATVEAMVGDLITVVEAATMIDVAGGDMTITEVTGGERGALAQIKAGRVVAVSEKVVQRDELRSSSGTGRGKRGQQHLHLHQGLATHSEDLRREAANQLLSSQRVHSTC